MSKRKKADGGRVKAGVEATKVAKHGQTRCPRCGADGMNVERTVYKNGNRLMECAACGRLFVLVGEAA